MDPSDTELTTWSTSDIACRDIAAWAGLSGDFKNALFKLIRIEGTTHFRVVGNIVEDEYIGLIKEAKLGLAVPSPAQRSQAGLFGRAARIASGTQQSLAALRKEEQDRAASVAKATAVGVAASPSKQGLIKLANVIDQHKEDEISIPPRHYQSGLRTVQGMVW